MENFLSYSLTITGVLTNIFRFTIGECIKSNIEATSKSKIFQQLQSCTFDWLVRKKS